LAHLYKPNENKSKQPDYVSATGKDQYEINLTKIDGDGAFPCPKCKTIISPDDETEDVYTIVETKVKNDELVGLILQCNKCGSKIKLAGFQYTEKEEK